MPHFEKTVLINTKNGAPNKLLMCFLQISLSRLIMKQKQIRQIEHSWNILKRDKFFNHKYLFFNTNECWETNFWFAHPTDLLFILVLWVQYRQLITTCTCGTGPPWSAEFAGKQFSEQKERQLDRLASSFKLGLQNQLEIAEFFTTLKNFSHLIKRTILTLFFRTPYNFYRF